MGLSRMPRMVLTRTDPEHILKQTVNSKEMKGTQLTRKKKETFIYNHISPTGEHTLCTNKMNLQVKSACAGPQCPILTTITVTLSAEPRCTALLASLLQAAS